MNNTIPPEIINIGSINTTHLSLGKLFINAKKPVICEKPLCENVNDTKELLSLAKEKKIFLMEVSRSAVEVVLAIYINA